MAAMTRRLSVSDLAQEERAKAGHHGHAQADRGEDSQLGAVEHVRLGITVSDVRMLPVEYSEVSISAPNTTMTSWPSRATPRTLDWAGSKFARSCGDMRASCARCPGSRPRTRPGWPAPSG